MAQSGGSVADIDSIFDPDRVLAAARDATGLSDFGDGNVREHVALDFAAAARRAALGHANPAAFAAQTQNGLEVTLRLEEAYRHNPKILEERIVSPIVILGLPRTGTTKIQRTLASDPRAQRTELWRLLFPVPVADAALGQTDPRIKMAERTVTAIATAAPNFIAAHPWAAEEVDEDTFLQVFTAGTPWAAVRLLDRAHLTTTAHQIPVAYENELKILKYLQWQDGGARGRHWVMKGPNHLGNLELVTKLYPDATIITTHRAVESCLPSLMRYMEAGLSMSESEFVGMGDLNLDLAEVGSFTLDFYAAEMERYLDQRERLGLDAEIIDLYFKEIVEDPFACIARTYGRREQVFDSALKDHMSNWLVENPAEKFGKHVYALERYGVSLDQVREAFARYTSRFRL